MPGERAYSTAATKALQDAYYNTNPRPRVEDIKAQAAAGTLEIARPTTSSIAVRQLVDPAIQAELAQISRARAFDLIAQDPRHNDQERNTQTLNTMRERLDTINKEGIRGESRAREAERLRRYLNEANQPSARETAASSEIEGLARILAQGTTPTVEDIRHSHARQRLPHHTVTPPKLSEGEARAIAADATFLRQRPPDPSS